LPSGMASALKAHCGDKALEVTKSAIQMHGAIGFTDEHDIGLYLKRAMWLSAWLGNAAVHRRRYMAMQG
jgi:alkylation response protein AidB-like acyl-CoA dehydrogenase